jgi:hypothetical protein
VRPALAPLARLGALALIALGAGLALAGPAAAAPTLVIRHAAMNIVVEPEERNDIAVYVYRPNAALPLEVIHDGANVLIDGHLSDFLTRCHGSGEGLHVYVFGHGDFGLGQMPQVQVRVPLDAAIDSGGVVHGAVTRAHSVRLEASGCGDWTVANVTDQLSASVSGIGDLRTGTSKAASVVLSGAGHLTVGPVETQLVAHLSGVGSLDVRSAGAADISISGSGGLTTGPIGGPLGVRVSGAGSLNTASVAGPVIAEVSGVGHVAIAGGHAPSMSAHVSGTGSIRFAGVADSLDAGVSGVGSVEVARVTGQVNQHVSGVGSVRVDGH